MVEYSTVQFVLENLGNIAGIFISICVIALFTKVNNYIVNHTTKAQQELIAGFINAFVKSADQLYHGRDSTGNVRNLYVRERLETMGITITDEIESLIEAAVWDVNQSAKSKGVDKNAGRKKGP